jgi:hypothetical protein
LHFVEEASERGETVGDLSIAIGLITPEKVGKLNPKGNGKYQLIT